MNRKILLATLLPLSLHCTLAHASVTLLEEMVLHTMLESTTTVLTTLGDYTRLNPGNLSDGTTAIGGAGITWSGSYSDTGWSYIGNGLFGGMALSMNYTGTVNGSYGAGDLSMGFAGTGTLGGKSLKTEGSSDWIHGVLNDYIAMHFSTLTSIGYDGPNPYYGWQIGREKYLCVRESVDSEPDAGQMAAVAGYALSTLQSIASSGKKVRYGAGARTDGCYSPITQAGDTTLQSVASLGKRGSMTISKMVKSTLSNTPHAAPAPGAEVSDFLSADNVGTLVADDGSLDADDMDNRYRSSGQFINGKFRGLTTNVPEPGTAWLSAMALLAMALSRARSLRLQVVSQRGVTSLASPT